MAEHGGPDESELAALGIDAAEVLDFSVNVNPYGPCPSVVRAIREAAIERYPDPTARAARQALARQSGVAAEEIVLGSGAADLLWVLARITVRPNGSALVVEPTFSEFRKAVVSSGARIVEWRASAAGGFLPDVDAIANLARAERPDALYVCAPNNPTGAPLAAAEIVALAKSAPDTVFVVDQSFLSLSDGFADAAVRLPENAVCVRSLTKDHAIPGVRVGYAIASRATAVRIERSRPAWATSAAAQAAALAAAEESGFLADSRRRLAADRERLTLRLRAIGLDPLPSSAPFLIVSVGQGSDLRRRLLARHRILVRDCPSFGLPGFLRIAARPEADVMRLVTALAAELHRVAAADI